MSSQNTYYVYTYQHPISLVPFYVGLGQKHRAFFHVNYAIKNPTMERGKHNLNTIRKILSENLYPVITILFEDLSKEQAVEIEKDLILNIGRKDKNEGPLTNQTDGGDGVVNLSTESREKQKLSFKTTLDKNPDIRLRIIDALKRSPYHVKGVLNPNYGKPKSEITKQRISENQQDYSGARNPNARSIILISPCGDMFESFGNFPEVCRSLNLSPGTMQKALLLSRIPKYGKCKGWKVNYA